MPFVAPAVFSESVRGAFGVKERERRRVGFGLGPAYRAVPVARMVVRELGSRVWDQALLAVRGDRCSALRGVAKREAGDGGTVTQ